MSFSSSGKLITKILLLSSLFALSCPSARASKVFTVTNPLGDKFSLKVLSVVNYDQSGQYREAQKELNGLKRRAYEGTTYRSKEILQQRLDVYNRLSSANLKVITSRLWGTYNGKSKVYSEKYSFVCIPKSLESFYQDSTGSQTLFGRWQVWVPKFLMNQGPTETKELSSLTRRVCDELVFGGR